MGTFKNPDVWKQNLAYQIGDFVLYNGVVYMAIKPVPAGTEISADYWYAFDEGAIIPTGEISITENGEVNVAQYATANVNVEGGGSSDLTTAHVTVMAGTVSETFETDAFNVCTFLETEGTAASVTAPIISDEPVESLEFDALLYKGAAALSTYLPVASTSGGITDHGDGHFLVTGDCTITLS